jgi:uncharacterized protein YjbI with pentapeptide repeats
MLVNSEKKIEVDKKFNSDESNSAYSNFLFVRLVAKGKKFTKVNFSHCTFDMCYLRNCRFDSCNFTGCRFVGTILNGSTFSGCKFDYAIFEKTTIHSDVLETECPSSENLKKRFARTLRMSTRSPPLP